MPTVHIFVVFYDFRFGNGNADNTYLSLSGDKLRLGCYSTSRSNSHLCGKNGIPAKGKKTPQLVITGANLVPRAGSARSNQWQRNKYTWKGTRYNVLLKMADCERFWGDVTSSGEIHTEMKMLSFLRDFHHLLHRKLLFQQLSVLLMMKISSKCRHFCFSANFNVICSQRSN